MAKYILTSAIGFSEECCVPQRWVPTGEDPMLDMVVALMCYGLYPNVCLHQGKRKVLTTEGKPALFHKTSVNCSNQEQRFPSPLFVFGEKVRTRAISCKQTTMVAPLHLLLFASRKVEWIDNVVRLDNWLNFDMSSRTAALVIALRPAVEKIVERAAAEPDSALDFTPMEQKVLNCLRALCVMNAGDYNIQREASTPIYSRPDGAKRGGSTRGWGTSGPRGGFASNQSLSGNRSGFGGTRSRFGGNQGGFGGNQGGFGGGQGGFGGNQGGNRSGFGGNQGGFGGNRSNFGGNQGGFGGNQGGFGGNQGGFRGNQGGYGGNQGGYGNRGGDQGGYGNGTGNGYGNGYGNGGRGFGRGGRGRGFWSN